MMFIQPCSLGSKRKVSPESMPRVSLPSMSPYSLHSSPAFNPGAAGGQELTFAEHHLTKLL